ncbi:hypothetical protein GYMLUDRAFT_252137 [Collybiopsis luxurians FD-317 M1]|uniref:TPR-like protein n=1 Tax=Collybiopsis luxurians FD-317 M1 TaxID=944289 RepID=A0A0D0C0Z5_9AGAR|nr:hypothetical protein GYMLUDRAFT_252137 [Collybiopsis luxurians FD-317 M1]
MSALERATKLKEEGNNLFSQKNYASAAAKYSEALQVRSFSRELFRSSCPNPQYSYLDAQSDAQKATQIDPGFAKAYARVATAQDALRMPYKSVESWKSALRNLPRDNLTPSQLAQKAEYEKGLAAAVDALDLLKSSGAKHLLMTGANETSDLPWVCAHRIMPQLMERGDYKSCAWALTSAYNEFTEGVRQIFSATTQGPLRFQSTTGLSFISNAILTDHRVFHITDGRFIQKYNEQGKWETTSLFNYGLTWAIIIVIGEAQFFRAWTEGGPDVIKQNVLKRLEEEGWGATRPALATTVRYILVLNLDQRLIPLRGYRSWIIQGFYQGGLFQNVVAEIEFIGRAIELIKWGREQFENVPKEDRGVIFEETFLRGVQMLHLEALLKVFPRADDETMEATLLEAEDVIAGVDAATIPPRESDPAFVSAYYYKPKGEALSMKGMYYRTLGNRLRARKDRSLLETMNKNYALSSRYYLEAAEFFLNAGLEMMGYCKTSPRDQLAVIERLRLSIPKMKCIWAQSSFAKQGGDILFKRGLDVENELREALKTGKFQLDIPVMLQPL